MGHRRKARECALQILFQIDLSGDDSGAVRARYWRANDLPDSIRNFADDLVEQTVQHRDAIDARLVDNTHNWRLDRMPVVDRNVLRMAISELLFGHDTPRPVVLNEALEVARKYGSDESPKFVNGVLDGVVRELESVASSG